MASADHSPDPVYCYNLDHSKTPGNLKVRWKIRVATGAEAERLDIIQQNAIIALLTWADTHSRFADRQQVTSSEIPQSNSSESIPAHI